MPSFLGRARPAPATCPSVPLCTRTPPSQPPRFSSPCRPSSDSFVALQYLCFRFRNSKRKAGDATLHGGVSKFPLSAAGESSLRFTPQHIKYSAKWGNQRKNYPKGGGHADTSLSRHGGGWAGADPFRRGLDFGRPPPLVRRPSPGA